MTEWEDELKRQVEKKNREHEERAEHMAKALLAEYQRAFNRLYGGGRIWDRAAECGEEIDYAEYIEEESLGQGRTINPFK